MQMYSIRHQTECRAQADSNEVIQERHLRKSRKTPGNLEIISHKMEEIQIKILWMLQKRVFQCIPTFRVFGHEKLLKSLLTNLKKNKKKV